MRKAFSKLTAEERRSYLDRARLLVYPGLEPATDEKEATIPAKARELYYSETTI